MISANEVMEKLNS